MIPTLLAAVGDTSVKADLLKGKSVGNMEYKVHLDGYNLLPSLKGEEKDWPRKEFIYWTDDGSVAALRYNQFKVTFLRQNAHGLHVWIEPFEVLRAPILTDLRADPFELAYDIGMGYDRWFAEHMFLFAPAGAYVGQWLQSFREFPPRQKRGSFNLDHVMQAVMSQQGAGR
jgi:arylsulfatase